MVLAQPARVCLGDAQQGLGGSHAGVDVGNRVVATPFDSMGSGQDRAVFFGCRSADDNTRVVSDAWFGSLDSKRRIYRTPAGRGRLGLVLSI